MKYSQNKFDGDVTNYYTSFMQWHLFVEWKIHFLGKLLLNLEFLKTPL